MIIKLLNGAASSLDLKTEAISTVHPSPKRGQVPVFPEGFGTSSVQKKESMLNLKLSTVFQIAFTQESILWCLPL